MAYVPKGKNYCPAQKIMQGITYISIHLFSHYCIHLLSIKLGTRGSKKNVKAPDLAGVSGGNEKHRHNATVRVGGFRKGKFKTSL